MSNFQRQKTLGVTHSAGKKLNFIRRKNILWIFFFFALPTTFAQAVEGNGNTLFILQANTHGNDNGGAGGFAKSMVELYNNADTDINLSAGNFYLHIGNSTTWTNVIKLSGIIPARSSFLVVSNNPAGNPTPRALLPDADQEADFVLVNDGFKVALMRNRSALLSIENPFGNTELSADYVDMLGVEGSNAFETNPASQSRPQPPRRISLVDTDDNAVDFRQTDLRGELLGNNRTPDSTLYRIWPRNSSAGAWNPISGEPAIHPTPYPHLTVEPKDPILPGMPDKLAGKLLILQAYSSASDANGTTHSFVELYNTTDLPINLNGITLFHANGTSVSSSQAPNTNTEDGEWRAIPLEGIIPPKTSFLILGRRQNLNEPNGIGSGNFPRFAIEDNSGDINDTNFILSNRAFKVALIRTNKDLTVQNPFTMDDAGIAEGYIDMVGSANEYQVRDLIFGFETSPTRNSASQSVRREICVDTNLPIDTDNNAEDFENIDFRAWTESNPGRTTDEQLEIFRPKNLGFGAWNPRTGERIEPNAPNLAQRITSFRFSNQSLGWENSGYWSGVINQNARTITFTTQRWIENIDQLPAIFELDDEGVARVNGVVQWSGSTQNDFRRNVIYTVGENEYTVIFVSPQATGLPVVNINTYGAEIHHSSAGIWTTMTFSLNDPNNPENDVATMTNQQVRGRGNSTWWNVPSNGKRPYRIRFRDSQQQGLFGLPQARNWVLLANYFDNSLMKTSVAFELGRRLGLKCTPTYHHVELFLNGDYLGSYLLTEHRQADPAEIGAPGRPKVDLTNGWFTEIAFQFDVSQNGDPGFRTGTWNMPVLIKSPEFPEFPHNGVIPSNVDNFVRNDWNKLEYLMSSDNFPNNDWRNLVDFESFARYFMVQIITQNADFNVRTYDRRDHPGSTFFYKQNSSSPIKAGPLWDFDLSLGRWFDDLPPSLRANTLPYPNYPFFNRFFQDSTFLEKYHEVWNENFIEHISTMPEFIVDLAAKLERSIVEDSRRWSRNVSVTNTEISRMRQYFAERIAFLDNFYNDDCDVTLCHRVIFSVVGYGGFMYATVNDVEVESGVRVATGSNIVFTAVPDSEFYVKGWRRNGALVNNNTTNTFTISNLSAATKITVEFDTESGIDPPLENPLRAWANNGILHITGLVAGETLRVFSVTGAMVFHNDAMADVMDIPLNVRGIFIVQNGNSTLKVIN